mgnify:CR=1 FL=1
MLYVHSLATSDNVLFVIRKHWYGAVQYFLIAFKFAVFNSQDIIIHFAVEHYFHYALVDILDSLIEERDIFQETALNFYKRFQSDMTKVLYDDFASLHKILVDYEFPNIPNGKAINITN